MATIADDGIQSAPTPDTPDASVTMMRDDLGRLRDGARQSQRAAERQRTLSDASALIASNLDLPVVLQHVVDAARDLGEARYAALGVIGSGDELDLFIHTGMDGDAVTAIGRLPTGGGLLGELIRHSFPLRLANLADHPSFIGFPPGHPPMGTFLGVPIRAGDRTYGNLYLTESRNGAFSEDDERLVIALAANAGLAIENARLYQVARRQREWLIASAAVTQDLFTGHLAEPLTSVVRFAAQGADADVAAISLRDADGHWELPATFGFATSPTRRVTTLADTLIGRIITTGRAVRLVRSDMTTELADFIGTDIAAAAGVPLLSATGSLVGTLSVARFTGRPPFVDDDVTQLGNFGNYVMAAIEIDRARAATESARTREDHGRIAADLHDHVIQTLFATGMGLQGMAGTLPAAADRAKVLGFVESLDDAIKQIRSTIFGLNGRDPGAPTIQQQVLAAASEQQATLGFDPHVTFSGPLNLVTSDGLTADVLAVTREGLANVARHAAAKQAWVSVSAEPESITLDISDDGTGPGASSRRSGLENLRRRAVARGGELVISPRPGGGTRLCWTAKVTPVGS